MINGALSDDAASRRAAPPTLPDCLLPLPSPPPSSAMPLLPIQADVDPNLHVLNDDSLDVGQLIGRNPAKSRSFSFPKRPSINAIKKGLGESFGMMNLMGRNRSATDFPHGAGASSKNLFADAHQKLWKKRKEKRSQSQTPRSKFMTVHALLEEMVKKKLERMELQKALCAKSLSADQREKVKLFMLEAFDEIMKDGGGGSSSSLSNFEERICTVLHPHTKTDEWQISAQTGDIVYVKDVLKTGWIAVMRVDKNSMTVMGGKGNVGILPGICCDWDDK